MQNILPNSGFNSKLVHNHLHVKPAAKSRLQLSIQNGIRIRCPTDYFGGIGLDAQAQHHVNLTLNNRVTFLHRVQNQ